MAVKSTNSSKNMNLEANRTLAVDRETVDCDAVIGKANAGRFVQSLTRLQAMLRSACGLLLSNTLLFLGMLGSLSLIGNCNANEIDFVRDIRPILVEHCYSCHSGSEQESGLRLDLKSAAFKGGDNHGPDIVPGKPEKSPLLTFVGSADPDKRMPPDYALGNEQILKLKQWIVQGAVWPDGVDEVAEVDRTDHWSFKPLSSSTLGSIDAFVDAKLVESGLSRSPPAAPLQWLRRVTFGLSGLPPSREETDAFATRLKSAPTEVVYAEVVDRLLASPRYGERWAQHWLDVVRFADTHGFEVNTERPNAWPYRDYVIRAFNDDTPYDRFVREQLVGDVMGVDPATGFLVTASVLLPGQIGKDAASIRLARQDALDEIVNNIGQTFLGLSIGCARCHDHKFDPLTSVDYYAMQAFVAGVEYEDREWRSDETERKKRQSVKLQNEVSALQRHIDDFAPVARPNSLPRTIDSKGHSVDFESQSAKFIRFEILDANLHSSLGLIEPCVDEFEIYADMELERNLALASNGTKVTTSGSTTSETHQANFVNDGLVGNASSWMTNTKGYGWLLFELPKEYNVSRVTWSRDRTGKFADRTATSYRIQIGESPERLQTVAELLPERPAVDRKRIHDRIPVTLTQRMRLTIEATNSLEPCIDEIEVFNEKGVNVALQSAGAKLTTSGDRIVSGMHQPSYIHDGIEGNDHSWLGSEIGKGWIELTFAQPEQIGNIVWSRDRTGSLVDRMPIEYFIEVETLEGWKRVADSTDRRPWRPGMDLGPSLITTSLAPQDAKRVNELIKERSRLESQIRTLEREQFVFAGKFRVPDPIHWLNRGDPEQPQELVKPAVPLFLGSIQLPDTSSDKDRRIALADWIANASNVLTTRVIVNRVWQGHFGNGLVDTPSDLGRSGSKPSHPELLDMLALRFQQDGWSMKRLHREIVLSETYCQSSSIVGRGQALQKDADARLLWRFPGRRLDAEEIRDTMLLMSGELRSEMYGRGFNLFDQRGGLSGFRPVETFPPDGMKRTIYAHKVRRERDAIFGAFDCPDAGQSTAKRRESTTPVQALNLFNSTFTLERANAFAKRIQLENGTDIQQQVRIAYDIALQREPSAIEFSAALDVVDKHGLAPLCRALFNCNEVIFVP